MSRIKFVTDSAADIPSALREQYHIQMLSFPIVAGGKEYLDGVDMMPQEFYKLLLSLPHIPTHSQINAYTFQECYEQAYAEGFDALIYTSINSMGSATYQSAQQAREEFYEDHPEAKDKFEICIVDSKNYTMGYGWGVIEGARAAEKGASAQEVAAVIQDWVDHVRVLFVCYDLKFAKKSGRVSAAAAFVGEALGLKPIMTFEDGQSKVLSKVRGEKNVVSAMLDMCEKERAEGTPYMVIRADRPDQAQLLIEQGTARLGQAPELDYYIGNVIAINAGPNLAGLVYRKK